MTDKLRLPASLPVRDLQLADVVELFEGAFGTAIVTEIEPDRVVLVRPYGTTSNFSYGGPGPQGSKVIPYFGWEECTYEKANLHPLKVLQRKEVQ